MAHSAGFCGYSWCLPLWATAHRQRWVAVKGASRDVAFSESGCSLAQSLEDLTPMFESWRELMAQILRSIPQQRGFWYTEPSMVAHLCAAAWRAGIPALAEAKTTRPSAPNAHVDLLVRTSKRTYGLEAKPAWINNTCRTKQVTTRLKAALSDAASLPPSRFDTPMGVVFVLFEPDEGQLLSDLFAAALPGPDLRPQVAAWHFDTTNVAYPGVLLLAKEVPMDSLAT